LEKARIELIPMIDTMAFLLVFFMIASLAMSQQQGMTVDLPRSTASVPKTWGDRALVVTYQRDGQIFLNKQLVRWGALEATVRARLTAQPELVVVINADKELKHGAVIRVIDAVKRAGAKHLAIATTKPETP
jgi:biopolymer transport protein ExbD